MMAARPASSSGGGFSSRPASSSYGRPASSSYGRPASAAGGGMLGGLLGSVAASALSSGGRYRQRPSSMMPFGMGAFAGGSAYSMLNSNSGAKCNGYRPECYKNTCYKALQACPAAAGETLRLARCPDYSYTECWMTADKNFLCLGRPRPSTTSSVDAYCAKDGSPPTPSPSPAPRLAAEDDEVTSPSPARASSRPGEELSGDDVTDVVEIGAAGSRGRAAAAASVAAGVAALLALLAA
ncbi:MAG: hypothetical protein J3K34DRAFT_437375 [Monoraphidium minutum]|nr:MAG: hypothetical protein J3K34DRAFT_437375 [Monoraphidium minutum]